jgi:hypothetical protein
VGLVNMNGRVYDPELGRFLTPDPTVQFLADLQSYNRYSYTANNPLRYTDPTGYAWYSFMTSGQFWVGLAMGAMGAVACAGSMGAGCVAMTMMAVYYQTSTMMLSGASFDQVAVSAILGAASGMAGGVVGGAIGGAIGQNVAGAVIAGAIAGTVGAGLSSLAMGGGLGWNLLIGAATGALMAGVSWSAQAGNPLAQADVANSRGDGGSGGDKVQAAEVNVVDGGTADAGDAGGAPGGREGGAKAWKATVYDTDAERGAMLANRLREELVGPLDGRYRVDFVNREATASDVGAMGEHDVMVSVLGKGGADKAMSLFRASGLDFDDASVASTVAGKFSGAGGGVALGRIAVVPVATVSPFGDDGILIGNIAAHEFGHAISNWGNPALDHATGGLMGPSIGTADGPLHFSPNFLNQFMYYH